MEVSSIHSMSDSTFDSNGNLNQTGGAISMLNSKLNIFDSVFRDNTADIAGAISFSCTHLTLCELKATDSTFEDNKATVKGGAIYYDYTHPRIENVTYTNNSAQYGPDIASYAVKIRKVGSQSDTITIKDMGSGIVLDETLHLELLDYENQVMVLENANSISIFPRNTSEASVQGINTALLQSGKAEFDGLIFIAHPGAESIQFYATSKAINTAKIRAAYNHSISDNDIFVSFRY